MKAWLDLCARRRALRVARRLLPHLPHTGRVLDVGSGTGHNAEALRAAGRLDLSEADVVDIHVVGPGPVPLRGDLLPFDDDAFDAATLCYVLQYPADPSPLLREAARVAHRVVLLQSTYRGRFGRAWLALREWAMGRTAFRVARRLAWVATVPCPMDDPRLLTREDVRRAAARAGLAVVVCEPDGRLPVSRDVFVLERARGP